MFEETKRRISESFLLGFRSETDTIEELDKQMRDDYRQPIEHFSDKVDELLNALNRVRLFVFT